MLRATLVAILCLAGGCVVRGLDGGNNQGLGGNNAPSADLGPRSDGGSDGGGCTCSCGDGGAHGDGGIDLGRPDGGPIDAGGDAGSDGWIPYDAWPYDAARVDAS